MTKSKYITWIVLGLEAHPKGGKHYVQATRKRFKTLQEARDYCKTGALGSHMRPVGLTVQACIEMDEA